VEKLRPRFKEFRKLTFGAQKEYYEEEVNRELESKKEHFQGRSDKSGDKERLLKIEIETLKYYFRREFEGEIIKPTDNTFNSNKLSWYRKLYQELIVQKKRTYHVYLRPVWDDDKDSEILPNREPEVYCLKFNDSHIEVEAGFKYLGWLEKENNLKENHPHHLISEDHLNQLLVAGEKVGFWDKNRKIILNKKLSPYSSGKKFLGMLVQYLIEIEWISRSEPVEHAAKFFLELFCIKDQHRKDNKHRYREFQEKMDPVVYDRICDTLKRNKVKNLF